jgi:hypothetical protein
MRPALLGALVALAPGLAAATTREIAELHDVRLAFGQSVLNQLSYGTYREPFDELVSRPHNLLFANIGRHPTLSPWEGQAGSYTRYFNALIGNNGTANVDNEADSIQGSLVFRPSDRRPGLGHVGRVRLGHRRQRRRERRDDVRRRRRPDRLRSPRGRGAAALRAPRAGHRDPGDPGHERHHRPELRAGHGRLRQSGFLRAARGLGRRRAA